MIVLLVVTGLMLLMPALTYLSSRRLIGKSIDLCKDAPANCMIYFYSKGCGPCRRMTPIVDQLADEHDNIFKVDVHTDPATAVKFGIRATPITVLVENHVVKKVLLGVKSKKQLKRSYAQITR
jgi:thioredoxin 1